MTRFLFLCLVLVACDQTRSERNIVESQQQVYATAQPVPVFDFSLERAVVVELYKARNTRVATHTVWRSHTGVVEGDCPSIAYPIPYDTSLTNPLQSAYAGATIEMAEPNGLFASHNSIATWIRCVHNGQEVPVYVEGLVTAYPYPVSVDYETGRVSPVPEGRVSVRLQSRHPTTD